MRILGIQILSIKMPNIVSFNLAEKLFPCNTGTYIYSQLIRFLPDVFD